jgi:DNA-binding MarR family transcriptional regulator
LTLEGSTSPRRTAASGKYVVIDNKCGQGRSCHAAGYSKISRQAREQRGVAEQREVSQSKGVFGASESGETRSRGGGTRGSGPRSHGRRPAALDLGELNDHVGYFVRRLQVAVFTDFITRLAPLKVRPAQYSVLVLIAANPGRSQAVIGQALQIERARLARLLHELEGRGWVERRRSSQDGRSHSLFVTAAGTKALARIKTLTARHEQTMTAFIGPERRAVLLKLLREFG